MKGSKTDDKLILFLILLFFLAAIRPVVASSPILDSLEVSLQLAKSDTQKVILYNQLAWEYKDQDLEKADEFVKKAIQLADRKAFRKGLAMGYKNKGVISLYQGEMEEAKQYLNDAILQFEILHDKGQKANTLNNLGMYWQMIGNNREALAHFEASAAIREVLGNEKWIGNSCNNLGVMHYFMGNYEEALQSHLRALKIWKRIGDQKEITSSFLNLGAVYMVMEDYDQALAYFMDGLRSAEHLENLRGMADAYANIGDVHLKRKDFPEALRYYQQALHYREILTDKTGIREALGLIGEVYSAQSNHHEAVNYYLRSLHISQAIGDKTGSVSQYNHLGQALIEQGKSDEALSYLFDGEKAAMELQLKPELARAYRLISKAYVVKKDYPLAFQYQQKYMETKDQIFSEESTQKMMEMKIQYESEVQKNEIDLLKKDKAIFELQRDRWVFISLMLLLFGVSAFIFYRYIVQTRTSMTLANQKREIAIKNQELQISNRDLEQFAHVVSHDLKQPMRTIASFIGLIERRYRPMLDREGEVFIDYVLGGVERMNSVLSDLLTYSQIGTKDNQEAVDLNQLGKLAIQNLAHMVEEHDAKITLGPLPTIFGDRSGLLRLFQNLIGNGIKFHREAPPEIILRAEEYSDHYLLIVEDNGIGIKKEYQHKIFDVFHRLHSPEEYPGTGIGLSICQKVVKQHKGELWVKSIPGKGSKFFFTLPKESVNQRYNM
ncbi:MAG: tetratricopeptide repeat protein [Bacteroidota bacterium]